MSRVTFVGELGWELYAPTEYGATLWAELVEAGTPHGMLRCGYKAIDSLRAEKGYRYWGSDVTPDETPYEGGLGFCVRMDKDDFVGRAALERLGTAPSRRLACLTLDDPRRQVLGNEPVRVGGRDRGTGDVGCGGVLGRAVDRVRLPAGGARRGRGRPREVLVFGEWVPATVAAEPLYDPKGERIRV